VSDVDLPRRYYIVGDEIRLWVELMVVQNVEEVRVVYGKDGRRHNTLTFIADVESSEDAGPEEVPGPEQGYVPHASPYRKKRITASLRMRVDVDHVAGHYYLLFVKYVTAAGSMVVTTPDDYSEAKLKAPSFRILEEASRPPIEARIEFDDANEADEDRELQ
jgi:hypothetical protein